MNECVRAVVMLVTVETEVHRGKTCPSASLSTKSERGLNWDRILSYADRPATKHRSTGTACL